MKTVWSEQKIKYIAMIRLLRLEQSKRLAVGLSHVWSWKYKAYVHKWQLYALSLFEYSRQKDYKVWEGWYQSA